MSASTTIPAHPDPLSKRPAVRAVLDRLHATSLAQEKEKNLRGAHFPNTLAEHHKFADDLIALDEDKARDMYLVLRAAGATRVVEAGTSYGVSLLWLLAAVLDNSSASSGSHSPLVIGTELEPPKVAKALSHVREAYSTIPSCLTLLEGDLLSTLPAANIPDGSLDALLLDIWAPLALPTLKILYCKLRKGAVVFIDNTDGATSTARYEELLEWLRDPANGFLSSTLPHFGGFELCVYVG